MLNKKFFANLKKEHDAWESERKVIIEIANQILHKSKRVIFSVHRGEFKKAQANLIDIEKLILNLEKKFGPERLIEEGSYKAGIEEYIEARLFFAIVNNQAIEKIKNLHFDYDSYLGGLCDVTGELVRRTVNEAASGNFQASHQARILIDEIMAELVEFDMTGYLRAKYDQARTNLRKAEQIDYEIKLKTNCQ